MYTLGFTPSHMTQLILGKRAGDRLIITNNDNNKSYYLLNIVVTA